MVADMVAAMEVDMVADMEVDKVADKVAKYPQFVERVGHGGWLIGPKLFRPEAYPTCVSSKLCEFIMNFLSDNDFGPNVSPS